MSDTPPGNAEIKSRHYSVWTTTPMRACFRDLKSAKACGHRSRFWQDQPRPCGPRSRRRATCAVPPARNTTSHWRAPNNGWSYFGLAELYKRRGYAEEAKKMEAELAKTWIGDRKLLALPNL